MELTIENIKTNLEKTLNDLNEIFEFCNRNEINFEISDQGYITNIDSESSLGLEYMILQKQL